MSRLTTIFKLALFLILKETISSSLTPRIASFSTLFRQDEAAKQELEKYIQEAKQNVNPRYRLTYHIAAPVGWINDPNGFTYFKGEYHLFYQYYPYDSIWGPMHWGHVTSKDLVNWNYRPTALLPEREQCFSGSAVEDDGRLVLIYTGHEITNVEPFFNQSQYIAFSDDGVNFEKYQGNPVIPAAPNGNPDFRDPKVWRHGDHWYVIIGSKTNDNLGRVLLYRSQNLIDWEFLIVLAESDGKLGYMWECPDFFELNGKFILLMSPQGIQQEGDRFKNMHQTGYIVGEFNYDNFEFKPIADFQELDLGHDFYAAQTMEIFGRRLVVSWFNMWDTERPEAIDGWAGAMTIVRQLQLREDNRLIQTPVPEMEQLRETIANNGLWPPGSSFEYGKAAEILVTGYMNKNIVLLLTGNKGGGKVWLKWNPKEKKVIVDREDDIRQVTIVSNDEELFWHIYLDTSSLELFCNDGEAVFSTRVFPLGGWVVTNEGDQDLKVESYYLKRSVDL